VAEDRQDDADRDPMADLAGLKPTVEKLRELLHAAAAAEEAAACMDAPIPAENPEEPVSGGSPTIQSRTPSDGRPDIRSTR
jgi:hypothetical protein